MLLILTNLKKLTRSLADLPRGWMKSPLTELLLAIPMMMSQAWDKAVAKVPFKLAAKAQDTFDKSKVMKSLRPRNFGVATRSLSRVATVRYVRFHTLGGFAVTKAADQVYAQSLDAAPAQAKTQERKDAIVTRSLALLGLNSKLQTDLDTICLICCLIHLSDTFAVSFRVGTYAYTW